MSSPYVGEIRIFAGNFAPVGWMFCNGAVLPISENETLFNLIGTTYGGDGQSTFALPDLQSRIPIHVGPGFQLAQTGGVEAVTLGVTQIPSHNHLPQAQSGPGDQASPANNLWARKDSVSQFTASTPNAPMSGVAIGASGGSQPHDNMPPFLAVNFILSLFGVYPSQT